MALNTFYGSWRWNSLTVDWKFQYFTEFSGDCIPSCKIAVSSQISSDRVLANLNQFVVFGVFSICINAILDIDFLFPRILFAIFYPPIYI